jgi:dipeptidyl aminopeptidase/acylaminoacyl peptidase
LHGGTPVEKPEQYVASSPITSAKNVQAPVSIFHGRNDTRTPARPIELYEVKMKSLGKDIAALWYEAGHTGPSLAQGFKFQAGMLLFVERVLNAQR